ncbi:hypothetical protein KIPB_014764, partial [Kipferlia bialata]|eukprot:g14764.t1
MYGSSIPRSSRAQRVQKLRELARERLVSWC